MIEPALPFAEWLRAFSAWGGSSSTTIGQLREMYWDGIGPKSAAELSASVNQRDKSPR